MRVTPAVVQTEHERFHDNAESVVETINETRAALGEAFDVEVESVCRADYREAVDTVFADGDLAVNVTALAGLLRELDVSGDYPGFVVDERLGRLLASTIAGSQPRATLAEATFHVADIRVESTTAGDDDLQAAMAAGFQTRLPGWPWAAGSSPFAVER